MSVKSSISPYGDENYNNFVFHDVNSYAERCKKKTEWVTRGRIESAFAYDLIFITLTYDKKHLPTTYKKCKELKIFSQRQTRKKIVTYNSDSIPEYSSVKASLNDTSSKWRVGHKWITRNSRPLDLSKNTYYNKEVFDESDFKNAKFKFTHSSEFKKYADCGLLVHKHLSDYLEFLRDAIRIQYNNPYCTLRFIANGEYGQNTHRPHFHILIFNHYRDFDFDFFTRSYWEYGKIISVQRVKKNAAAIQKLSAYICAHTVKNDLGNTYQNELAPPFRLTSTYGGGIGYQLVGEDLSDIDDSFCRSLSNSLSAWDKRSSVKYQITDENNTHYEYEFPRYYKDKMLNYLSLDIRSYWISHCRTIVNLVRDFCKFAHLSGNFDLLPIFHNIGLLGTPKDILTFFIQSNFKIIAKNFSNCNFYINLAAEFLNNLKRNDDIKRAVFKDRFSRRKQEKKYQDYLRSKGLINLN